MLAMGRALMSHPKLIVLDEPSMGLSPIYVNEVFDIIQSINRDGVTVLLVEQNAKKALSIANQGVCTGDREDRFEWGCEGYDE